MKPRFRQEAGQGTLEWLIAFPAMILLLGGVVQSGLVFTTKSTLDWATFRAVRAATLDHGSLQALKTGLAQGIMPLFPEGKSPGMPETVAAYAAARNAVDNSAQTRIEILNPTPSVAQAWTETVNKEGETVQEIPNSRLLYTSDGPKGGETLQTANEFKARVTYCYPLMVPFVSQAIEALMTGPFAPNSAWKQNCYAQAGIPIDATATERMESAIYPQDLNTATPANATPPGGTPPTTQPGGGTAPGCGG